ncbi:hypothetical protein [Candidatus Cardinium hertigii]|uniref:Shikimate kinase n=1 Tax=Candidatus Cardinium hertigii TaxID=247481 RepID=A0A2Z3L795_9BACT|nr:hypothetical protein [Candidatus Cardinium hertigii]AWN81578.1 hypothetical protein DK880_00246 [Candidatus Cardinium hertigii]
MHNQHKNSNHKIIYLIGKPGIGKYTISQELSKFGYVICDNHLINNPILSLLPYDGLSSVPESIWSTIAHIRHVVYNFIEQEAYNSYVLTNVLYEVETDQLIYQAVEQMAEKRKSLYIPVKLSISEKEHVKRIVNPSRKIRYKSINPEDVYIKYKLIEISHPNLLELDVTTRSAKESAETIVRHISCLQ